MALTLGQQLDEVQNAISAVTTSQSYESGGNSLTRARLEALEAREEKLLRKIESAPNGRNTIEGQNTTPKRKGPRIKKAVW